jgi:hypothetical protein
VPSSTDPAVGAASLKEANFPADTMLQALRKHLMEMAWVILAV